MQRREEGEIRTLNATATPPKPREWPSWADDPIDPAAIENVRETLANCYNEIGRLRRRVKELEQLCD